MSSQNNGDGAKRLVDRRKFLVTGAATTAALTAGCSGSGDGGDGGDGSGGDGSGGDGSDGDGGGNQTPSNETTAGMDTFQNEAGNEVGATFEVVEELAREEGETTIYASIDRGPFDKWVSQFNEKYPDVKINHVTGGSEKLRSRYKTEYETNNAQAGGIITAGIQVFWEQGMSMQLQEDYFPSIGDVPDKYRGSEGYWIAVRQVLGNIHYNEDMVSADAASSWMDVVTNPDWTDQRTGWDPTPNIILMSWLFDSQGTEFFQNLHDQNPRWVDSHTDLARLCGAGEFPVCFTYTHKMGRFGNKLPLNYFKFDKTPAELGPATVNNKAPSPNATLLFMNWLSSVEGQNAIGQSQYIPWHPDAKYHLYEGVWPAEGTEIVPIRTAEVDHDAVQNKWEKYLGDLITAGDTD